MLSLQLTYHGSRTSLKALALALAENKGPATIWGISVDATHLAHDAEDTGWATGCRSAVTTTHPAPVKLKASHYDILRFTMLDSLAPRFPL